MKSQALFLVFFDNNACREIIDNLIKARGSNSLDKRAGVIMDVIQEAVSA